MRLLPLLFYVLALAAASHAQTMDRQRRLLGPKCPPGLDICRQEAKREAEEKAARAAAKTAAATEAREKLEQLSTEQKAERDRRAQENEEKRLRREAERLEAERQRRESEAKAEKAKKQLFKGFMKVREWEYDDRGSLPSVFTVVCCDFPTTGAQAGAANERRYAVVGSRAQSTHQSTRQIIGDGGRNPR